MYFEEIDLLDGEYDEDLMVSLEFDLERNEFIDLSGGWMVHDIYCLIKPWQIFLFKQNKRDYVFRDITNTFLVELFWPEDDYGYIIS